LLQSRSRQRIGLWRLDDTRDLKEVKALLEELAACRLETKRRL